jgi:hypothetical protein
MFCHVFLLRIPITLERCREHKAMLWPYRVANHG